MSDEKFKRSETGHSASDLHKHGGLDVHEEKTERENLEDAIEALNDSEETENLVEIAEDMDGDVESDDIEEIKEDEIEKALEEEPEEEPAEKMSDEEIEQKVAEALREHKEEPVNNWKTKAENQPYMTIDTVEEPKAKKKSGAGWKLTTVFFLLLAVAGCGAAAYLFFNDGKTELMGRVVTSQTKEAAKNDSSKPASEIIENPSFDFDSSKIDYSGITELLPERNLLVPFVVDYTKDGKYMYAIGDVYVGSSTYAATFYRENKKDAEWQILQSGQTFVSCDEYTDAQKKFMKDYKYIDDDLSSKYVGCYEDADAETVYPE